MIVRRAFVWAFLTLFFGFLAFLSGLASAQTTQISANELVREVVNNELILGDRDHSHWMYRIQTEKPNGSKDVDEIVETSQGNLKRPVLIEGHEPSAEEQQKAEEYLQEVARNPRELQKAYKQGQVDQEHTTRMFKLLPDAFNYAYGEERGDLVKMTFVPNPQFHPPSREAEVFHALEGYMWVDRKQKRLAEIAGHLVREVKFMGGFLGHLDQGGTFDVKREEVGPGCWKITLLKVNMTGKALFFKTISEHQDDSRSDFRRIPDNLTLAQAADLLDKQVTAQLHAANGQSKSLVRARSE